MSTNEQQRAHRAALMRKWRAANPERNREIGRLHKERWRAEHPGEANSYMAWWRKQNPQAFARITAKRIEKRKAARAANPEPFRAYDRSIRQKFTGMGEQSFHQAFAKAHPNAVSMDAIRPDFYVPNEGFVEIKLALPFQAYNWRQQSEHFPGLFFRYVSSSNKRSNGDRRTVDAQLALEPRPLLVLVFNPLTGEEIARRYFT